MKISFIRELLESYGIERIYFVPEGAIYNFFPKIINDFTIFFKKKIDESKRKQRIQMKGNKQRKYTEGWVEFSDKRVAKMAALTLNCTKMGKIRDNMTTLIYLK